MNGFRAELYLHVIFVIVALGGVFVLPLMQAAAERAGAGATRFYLGFLARVQQVLIFPGAVIVFIMGGLLMSNDHFPGHDDPPAWLIISLIWFVVAVIIAFFTLRTTLRDATAALDGVADNSELPAAYRPLGQRLQMILGVFGITIIVIAFLMVWQPGG